MMDAFGLPYQSRTSTDQRICVGRTQGSKQAIRVLCDCKEEWLDGGVGDEELSENGSGKHLDHVHSCDFWPPTTSSK